MTGQTSATENPDAMYEACIDANSAKRLCLTCNQLKRNDAYTVDETNMFFGSCGACVSRMSEIWDKKRKYNEALMKKERRHARTIPQRMAMQKLRSMATYLKKRLQNPKYKTDRLKQVCGCDADTLKLHIESCMKAGMNWNNIDKWYISFKRPCKEFNLTDRRAFLQCAHYTNLGVCWNKKSGIV